jgi:hypothetical protein
MASYRRERHNYRKRSLQLVVFLLLFASTRAAAVSVQVLEKDKKNNSRRRRQRKASRFDYSSSALPSSKTRAAIRAERTIGSKDELTSSSRRMSEQQPSLAKRLAEISDKDASEFALTLLEQTTAQHATLPPRLLTDDRFRWALVGTVIVVAAGTLASQYSTLLVPSGLLPFNTEMVVSSVSSIGALLPWMWLSGMKSHEVVSSWVLDSVAMAQLLSARQVQLYVKDKILPYTWDTLQKMMLMEVWRRVWMLLGSSMKEYLAQEETKVDSSSSQGRLLPKWVHYIYNFFEEMLKRGTKSLIRKTVEKNVQDGIKGAVVTATMYVASAGDDSLTSIAETVLVDATAS